MFKDEYGSWVLGACIIIAHEDSDIFAAGLKTLG